MPHLSKLAKEYQDKVTFVAISDESKATVEEFLTQPSSMEGKTWGQAMAFTVATDPDKSTKESIFSAAGQRGIPSSFIISDGAVEWIGHPMRMDAPLAAVVGGTWDRASFKKEFEEKIAVDLAMGKVRGPLRRARQEGNWGEVVNLLDGVIEKFRGDTGLMMQKWTVLITRTQRDKETSELGRGLLKACWKDSQRLNQIAWTVVDDKNVRVRDLGFAMKAAVRANELTKSQDAMILDTLARVHHDKGDLDQALHFQRLAVKYAGKGRMGDGIRQALEKYEKKAKEKKKGEDF